jgi:hypothetical protein
VIRKNELPDKNSVIRKFRITATDGKTYQVEHYNLDVIISVGYRVNSKRAIQFRIWATKVLKDHLALGYSLNRLRLKCINWPEFERTMQMIKNASTQSLLPTPESLALLDIISKYAKTFVLLQSIDTNQLDQPSHVSPTVIQLDIDHYRLIIQELRNALLTQKQASEIFGQERGDGFDRIIGSVYQTFGGVDVYTSIEEKAAHLYKKQIFN